MAASGKYYVDAFLGNVFVGTTAAAGVILPVYSNTAQTFVIWNPLGSGKNIIPINLTIGYVSTTAAASNFVLAYQTGCGAQSATASPITAITLATPVNMNLGAGNSSIAKFAPATATFTAGLTLLKSTGFNQLVTTAATTGGVGWTWREDYDGTLIIPPGVALAVCGNIAPLQTNDVSLVWEESPVSG